MTVYENSHSKVTAILITLSIIFFVVAFIPRKSQGQPLVYLHHHLPNTLSPLPSSHLRHDPSYLAKSFSCTFIFGLHVSLQIPHYHSRCHDNFVIVSVKKRKRLVGFFTYSCSCCGHETFLMSRFVFLRSIEVDQHILVFYREIHSENGVVVHLN